MGWVRHLSSLRKYELLNSKHGSICITHMTAMAKEANTCTKKDSRNPNRWVTKFGVPFAGLGEDVIHHFFRSSADTRRRRKRIRETEKRERRPLCWDTTTGPQATMIIPGQRSLRGTTTSCKVHQALALLCDGGLRSRSRLSKDPTILASEQRSHETDAVRETGAMASF
ncbi:hypothetical protein B7494_g6964 [Chlorociboria aeruginascens]|nr:hypothetical protein B7494_g6964 [Chlorociboria aeruginascens]